MGVTKKQRAQMGLIIGQVYAEWAAEQAGEVTLDRRWSTAEPSQYPEHAEVMSASDEAQADLRRRTATALAAAGIVLPGDPQTAQQAQRSATLARLELETGLELLFKSLPDLRLDEEHPARIKCNSLVFRGFDSLPLRW